jgi:hypothetical protein
MHRQRLRTGDRGGSYLEALLVLLIGIILAGVIISEFVPHLARLGHR